jgi:hypothetical protein
MWLPRTRPNTPTDSPEPPRQQQAQQSDSLTPVVVNAETAYHHYRKMAARQTELPSRSLSKLDPS